MCDLFVLSAGEDYSAPKSLPLFAKHAKNNMDGWGIGYFKKYKAFVEKSADRAYVAGRVHDSFQRLARVVNSRIILCHVRFQTSGPVDECHAHPFVLEFGGHNWLFAHNGQAPAVENYRTTGSPIEGAQSDSARAFEYLRDRIISRLPSPPQPLPSLFQTIYQSTAQLLEEYPGNYNYLLTNGWVLFAFTNHRRFMLLKRSTQLEGALMLTTLRRGLSDEHWMRLAKSTNKQGLLLMISGTDIIFREQL
ncbi:MAG: class II glutamine amidotransferase [Deltaproteobacteria bacterium]|jgi:glutamine amidotransferase|nr:class II glutamine amidotransferase [Deltaproteobacteria bacterium]